MAPKEGAGLTPGLDDITSVLTGEFLLSRDAHFDIISSFMLDWECGDNDKIIRLWEFFDRPNFISSSTVDRRSLNR